MPNPVPPNDPAEPDALTDTESRRSAGTPVRADGVGSALTAGVDRGAQPGESASPAASAEEGTQPADGAVAAGGGAAGPSPERDRKSDGEGTNRQSTR